MGLSLRGEGSLYGAIVVAIIFSIAVSTLYSYMASLNKTAGDIYSSLSSVMGDLGASVYFTSTASNLYIYSDRSLNVVGVFVYSPMGLLYSRISSGEPIAIVSPSSPLDLSSIVPQSLITQILSGGAFLGVLTSNGMIYTYRYTDQGSVDSGVVNNDMWSLGLLAIARSMPGISYTSPGVYWLSGDEGSGSVRVTMARSIFIAEGVTLYTADPREVRWTAYSLGSDIIVYNIGAIGGSGVTRIIVADTIIVNGTITSRGLGSYSNILYSKTFYGDPYSCPLAINSPAGAGTVASGAGGGAGESSGSLTPDRGWSSCPGLAGGSASLFGYTTPGGQSRFDLPPTNGGTINYRAFVMALMLSPYQLANLSLYGAGGGSGGPGYGYSLTYVYGGAGGRGGGGIVIICNRFILNNGIIDASGEDGRSPTPNTWGGGGGGGGAGAIFIYCNSVEGTGVIKARGGSGGPGNGLGMPGGRGGDGWVVIIADKISSYIRIDTGSGYKIIALRSGASG